MVGTRRRIAKRLTPGVQLLGFVWALLAIFEALDHDASVSAPLRQWVVLGALGAGCLLLLWILRGSAGRMGPALLVPLTTKLVFLKVLWALPIAQFHREITTLEISHIVVAISGMLVLTLVVHVVYVAWISPLAHAVGRGRVLGVAAAWADALPNCWAALRSLCQGILPLMGVWILLMLPLTSSRPPDLAWLLLLGAVLLGVIWNVLTSTLVLRALPDQDAERLGFRDALREGWALKRRLWIPVLLHTLLLGTVTWASASWIWTHDEPARMEVEQRGGLSIHRAIHARATRNQTTRTHWGAHTKWTGGYEHASAWLPKTAAVRDDPVDPLVSWVAALLLAIVAVRMKIHIAWVMGPGNPSPPTPIPPLGATTLPLMLALALACTGCGERRSSRAPDAESLIQAAFHAVPPECLHVKGVHVGMIRNDAEERLHGELVKVSQDAAGRGALDNPRGYVVRAAEDTDVELTLADRADRTGDDVEPGIAGVWVRARYRIPKGGTLRIFFDPGRPPPDASFRSSPPVTLDVWGGRRQDRRVPKAAIEARLTWQGHAGEHIRIPWPPHGTKGRYRDDLRIATPQEGPHFLSLVAGWSTLLHRTLVIRDGSWGKLDWTLGSSHMLVNGVTTRRVGGGFGLRSDGIDVAIQTPRGELTDYSAWPDEALLLWIQGVPRRD